MIRHSVKALLASIRLISLVERSEERRAESEGGRNSERGLEAAEDSAKEHHLA
jgi:hypothetical protein